MSGDRMKDRIDEAVLALLWPGIVERYPTGIDDCPSRPGRWRSEKGCRSSAGCSATAG